MFTLLQQIPQSPAQTVQMGSSSVREEILATSAKETASAERLKTQSATKEEPEIPQPEEPEIAIPEVVMQLTDTPLPADCDSDRCCVMRQLSQNIYPPNGHIIEGHLCLIMSGYK